MPEGKGRPKELFSTGFLASQLDSISLFWYTFVFSDLWPREIIKSNQTNFETLEPAIVSLIERRRGRAAIHREHRGGTGYRRTPPQKRQPDAESRGSSTPTQQPPPESSCPWSPLASPQPRCGVAE
ncbi:hypothetical protein PIB30_039566 [Stylosanthes scabra]|uniref:Uncharacterized protein n=1 Tax=Stylosanthes scabra TaxID=79078 RepID=A0ABU6VCI9_9FABA|nr:hypothetical protein [Stylosanthes scabra]